MEHFAGLKTRSTPLTIPPRSAAYFAAVTRAALVLSALRAPYRGRCSPVNGVVGLV